MQLSPEKVDAINELAGDCQRLAFDLRMYTMNVQSKIEERMKRIRAICDPELFAGSEYEYKEKS
jgi:hypothetical protein